MSLERETLEQSYEEKLKELHQSYDDERADLQKMYDPGRHEIKELDKELKSAKADYQEKRRMVLGSRDDPLAARQRSGAAPHRGSSRNQPPLRLRKRPYWGEFRGFRRPTWRDPRTSGRHRLMGVCLC